MQQHVTLICAAKPIESTVRKAKTRRRNVKRIEFIVQDLMTSHVSRSV